MPHPHTTSALTGSAAIALVLDFDGTLHAHDINQLLWLWALRHHPRAALAAACTWLIRGWAASKLQLAQLALQHHWRPVLTWHGPLLAFAAQAAQQGRPVWIATGSAQSLVTYLVQQNGLPYPVLGTTQPSVNLVAQAKAQALVARWGEKGFDYAGNSADDLAVWPHARQALIVNATAAVLAQAQACSHVARIFPAA